MGAAILVTLLFFQQQHAPVQVFIPTSDAIDVARKLARDLGYPIDRYPKLYFFDESTPSFPGYVSIGFYGNGHPINHFEINERTGQVVDNVICEVYDFPDLKVFRRELQHLSGSRARTTEELMDEIGCDKLTVVRSPIVRNQVPPMKDLSCVEDLKLPLYQQLARDARASGTARAVVTIGTSGNAGSIEVQGRVLPIITGMVKSALQAARFRVSCAGKSVEINFVYRLDGKPSTAPKNQVSFKGPNTFEIVSTPAMPIPTEPQTPAQ